MAKGSPTCPGRQFALAKLSQKRDLLPYEQIRRAAISVPANIAEGFRKRGVSDKTRFLNVAQGSLEECRYYLILTQDLGYACTEDAEAVLVEVSKLLVAYASAIESNRRTGS